MAFELPVELISREANATLAAATIAGTNPQFCFGVLDANGRVQTNSVANGQCFGVIQDPYPSYLGYAVNLIAVGVSKVICGAALTPGTTVMSDANGHAIPYVVAGTNVALGTVLGGTANALEIASIQLALL
jgi:hypothetical protein